MRGQLAQSAATTASMNPAVFGAVSRSSRGQELKQRISVASERFGIPDILLTTAVSVGKGDDVSSTDLAM